ncbi:MAG: hypothetical protein LDL41_02870, partial [Coleofasciculus sp. S288]|nr:hypothetical protein [Coleofasciculus sp. S288]
LHIWDAPGRESLYIAFSSPNIYSKRQKAVVRQAHQSGRRQKGKNWLVKVSGFGCVLIALATAIPPTT